MKQTLTATNRHNNASQCRIVSRLETDVPGTKTLTRPHREFENCCGGCASPLAPVMYNHDRSFDPEGLPSHNQHLGYPTLCAYCAHRRFTMSGCLSHTKYALWLEIQSFLSSARLMSKAYNRREIIRRISA